MTRLPHRVLSASGAVENYRRVAFVCFARSVMGAAVGVHVAPRRVYSSSSSSLGGEEGGGRVISSEELRAALRVLSLPDDATDADIKSRFQALAKSHHPDVLQGMHTGRSDHHEGDSSSNGDRNRGHESSNFDSAVAERLRVGMAAYRLLRSYTAVEREMILRASHTMENTRRRAARMYHGRPRTTVSESNSNNKKKGSTAEFNNFQRRMEKMRGGAPPWNVNDAAALSRAQSLNFMFHVHHTSTNSNDYSNSSGSGGNSNKKSSGEHRRGLSHHRNVGISSCDAFPDESAEARYTRMRRRHQTMSMLDVVSAVAARYQITLGVCLVITLTLIIMAYNTVSEERKRYLEPPPAGDELSHE